MTGWSIQIDTIPYYMHVHMYSTALIALTHTHIHVQENDWVVYCHCHCVGRYLTFQQSWQLARTVSLCDKCVYLCVFSIQAYMNVYMNMLMYFVAVLQGLERYDFVCMHIYSNIYVYVCMYVIYICIYMYEDTNTFGCCSAGT